MTVLIVVAGGLASASAAGTLAARIRDLPAPVTVQAGAGRFQIERDGRIRRLPPVATPFPRDAAYFPGLLLRGDAGDLRRTVARNPAAYTYDATTQSLYFISRGQLIRSLGAAHRVIASMTRLGFRPRKPDVELVALGSLVELLTNGRLIILSSSGSIFAGTRLPDPHGGIASQVTVAPGAGAVAYTTTSRDTESVYVLRRGASAAVAVHAEALQESACERGVGLQWHGRWLLYGTSSGNAAVIDGAGKLRTIELTAVVDRLAGPGGGITVYWSGQPPQF